MADEAEASPRTYSTARVRSASTCDSKASDVGFQAIGPASLMIAILPDSLC
jgi:hypothetical protein